MGCNPPRTALCHPETPPHWDLSKGFSIAGFNSQDGKIDWATSPVHVAAMVGNTGAIDELLNGGVNPNLRAVSGETPLVFAAAFGKIEAAQLLAAKGADINAGACSELGAPIM